MSEYFSAEERAAMLAAIDQRVSLMCEPEIAERLEAILEMCASMVCELMRHGEGTVEAVASVSSTVANGLMQGLAVGYFDR